VDTEGRRRSNNFEDRGEGERPMAAGAGPLAIISLLARFLGIRGMLVLAAVVGIGYVVAPSSVKRLLGGWLSGSESAAPGERTAGGGSTCAASPANTKACDFSRVVLASTEDVWAAEFRRGDVPGPVRDPGPYRPPTLVVFSDSVATGCGDATASIGPFYCAEDRRLYIDPSFYRVMERHLRAPGDFAQAYVIAHEVGHHVQNLVGTNRIEVPGEGRNQRSVRLELQADCLAGVWGHTARAALDITDADLAQALNAAHAIGDDTLGATPAQYTHGTSAQRMRWFRRGFDSGEARNCDTFSATRKAL
jgi:predicted metalloprotease